MNSDQKRFLSLKFYAMSSMHSKFFQENSGFRVLPNNRNLPVI